MNKIVWSVIFVWSLIAFFTVLFDYFKWKPTSNSFAGKLKDRILYRLKMAIKMIIPGILAAISGMGIFLK